MTNNPTKTTVLVTGAAGFIASHCIQQLLAQGYQVRGTVRSIAHQDRLRQMFADQVSTNEQLTFVQADLLADDGWSAAVSGCDYVLHVASPFPPGPPKHEDDLIIPAREGTLRVLQAAAAASVKRVVLTSSIAAMLAGYDQLPAGKIFDERDWSNTDGNITPYAKSKTLAERAAWDYVNNLDKNQRLELAVINPGTTLGPLLNNRPTTSGELVRKLLRREYPGCANLSFALVDVRDVAAAHLSAMTIPEAAGQRFCCTADTLWMQEIALILDKHFSSRGYKIPTRKLPNFMVHLVALFDQTTRLVIDGLDRQYQLSNQQIRTVLHWQPRSAEEMIVATAESMIRHGMV